MSEHDMSTAPTDGTRVLLKCKVHAYNTNLGEYQHRGYEILECRYHKGKWIRWCGHEMTFSTAQIDPVAWMPIPDGMKDDRYE